MSDEFIEHEIRRSRGEVLGAAVWRRLAEARGDDPKDPALVDEANRVTDVVAAASQVLEEAGFDGVERWLKLEADFLRG